MLNGKKPLNGNPHYNSAHIATHLSPGTDKDVTLASYGGHRCFGVFFSFSFCPRAILSFVYTTVMLE